MVVSKTNPAGIDLNIQRLQNYLYTELLKLWPVGIRYTSYGRCYQLANSDGQSSAMVCNANEEYQSVLFDDARDDVCSFFGVEQTEKSGTRIKANVHFVVMCNLQKLKPGITAWRADEEVRSDILRVIGKCMYQLHFVSVETGMKNVFKDYRETLAQLSHTQDAGNLHCFRINFFTSYNPFQTLLNN